MSETEFSIIFFGPLLVSGFLLFLIKTFRYFITRRIQWTLNFIEKAPVTVREIVEHFKAEEYLVVDALNRMIRAGLVVEQVRSCWTEAGDIQRPVTVYAITHVGRQALGTDDQQGAIAQLLYP